MPIVDGSENWLKPSTANENYTRPLLKARAGLVTADVVESEIASCAVTCSKLARGHVVSEVASCGLQRRTVSFLFSKASSTETGGEAAVGTTAIEVWRPSVAVNVLNVEFAPVSGKYGNATCDNFTLYGNAGTCIGHFPLKTVSTGILRGARTAIVGLTQVALAADTPVLCRLITSTCSETVDALFTLHYQTTN